MTKTKGLYKDLDRTWLENNFVKVDQDVAMQLASVILADYPSNDYFKGLNSYDINFAKFPKRIIFKYGDTSTACPSLKEILLAWNYVNGYKSGSNNRIFEYETEQTLGHKRILEISDAYATASCAVMELLLGYQFVQENVLELYNRDLLIYGAEDIAPGSGSSDYLWLLDEQMNEGFDRLADLCKELTHDLQKNRR